MLENIKEDEKNKNNNLAGTPTRHELSHVFYISKSSFV